jgi:hypothetical protein
VSVDRSDRSYSDQRAGGWLKSPPGEILVLAGGLSRPRVQMYTVLAVNMRHRQHRDYTAGGCLMPPASTLPSINIEQPFFPATFQWRFAREELGKGSKNNKSMGEGSSS